MRIKKKSPSNKQAKEALNQVVNCLYHIPSKDCTEEANRKIDEAIAYCYITKDLL